MPDTYIDLCNQVLRRLNEVEIPPSEFATARGVQALVKDAIRSAVASINQSEFEWPFNAAQHVEPLVIGRTEYNWPTGFKVVDYNSFQVIDNYTEDLTAGKFFKLQYIERDVYLDLYRDRDNNSHFDGIERPRLVCPSHGNGYIVTPSPDKAYSVRFNYFLNYADLQLFDDETRVPQSFSNVIVDGALMHLYMFKDNVEAAQVAKLVFEQGLKNLQTLYINNYESVTDRRVAY